MEFTFGTDPEFMISRWEELHSAISLLPKKEQALVKNGNKFYYDNVLAEIAVKPAKNKDEAITTLQKQREILDNKLKTIETDIDVEVGKGNDRSSSNILKETIRKLQQ